MTRLARFVWLPLALALAACSGPAANTPPVETTPAAAPADAPAKAPAAKAPPMAPAGTVVLLTTSMGAIKIELNAAKAPKSVANFLAYVKSGHYKGTIFHRVIDGFMIQGGGFDASYTKKETGPSIQNEADNGLKNDNGTIAMARTQDPHSASAQFFINVSDNDMLNHRSKDVQGWGYCVFGKVIEGMDVVNKIKGLTTGPGGPFPKDAPQTQVLITDAKVL